MTREFKAFDVTFTYGGVRFIERVAMELVPEHRFDPEVTPVLRANGEPVTDANGRPVTDVRMLDPIDVTWEDFMQTEQFYCEAKALAVYETCLVHFPNTGPRNILRDVMRDMSVTVALSEVPFGEREHDHVEAQDDYYAYRPFTDIGLKSLRLKQQFGKLCEGKRIDTMVSAQIGKLYGKHVERYYTHLYDREATEGEWPQFRVPKDLSNIFEQNPRFSHDNHPAVETRKHRLRARRRPTVAR